MLVLSLCLLALALYASISRPLRIPEALVAVPAAILLLLIGAVDWARARDSLEQLFPVVAFLAAALALSEACRREGLFEAAGVSLQRLARGQAKRVFALTFVMAAAVTAVLSLDATVVLLTPVVLHAARKALISARPAAYATGHLANSASLLLPVSNLTNLLAYQQSGLSFVGFAGRMVLPWVAVIAIEYLALRLYFRRDFHDSSDSEEVPPMAIPRFAAAVVNLVLVGFAVTSPFGIEPAWVAGAGALVLTIRGLLRREATVVAVCRSLNLGFCLFVLALGIIVDAVAQSGANGFLVDLLPHDTSLASLLIIAAVAAVLANIVNNLPATLLLLPILAPLGPDGLLAMLIGVNVGPNLTYVGSLATLLWRRVLKSDGEDVRLGTFTAVGVLTTVPAIAAAVSLLWVTS